MFNANTPAKAIGYCPAEPAASAATATIGRIVDVQKAVARTPRAARSTQATAVLRSSVTEGV
jgi:hypothetical protein